MNITCPQCKAKLNLPDDKIPKDRDSSFKCPKCKAAVHIKARAGAAASGSDSRLPSSPDAEVLVCMTEGPNKVKVMAVLGRAGWVADDCSSTDQALSRLAYQTYPLVLMDDLVDQDGEMSAHLSEMDMSLRRRICLILFSRRIETGDAMAAMHASCNYVIRTGDADQGDEDYVAGLLTAARKEHEDMYRVYNDAMRAVGKA